VKCILIVFEGERPAAPPVPSGLKGTVLSSKALRAIPYGTSAYVVVAADAMTTDEVLKKFQACGENEYRAIAVKMDTYSGCGSPNGDAQAIQALLNE
jgi:hypothetical protein